MKKNRIWIACLIILLCILTGSLLYFFYFNTTTFPKQTISTSTINSTILSSEVVEAQAPTEETEKLNTDTSLPVEDTETIEADPLPHQKVKGIYVTGPMAGSAAMDDLIALVDETELNAMVIDVKNDDGAITYAMDLDKVQSTNACIAYIPDINELMQKLKEHHIYTIARIVCFKDPVLAKAQPDLALKKTDGTPITDANGLSFVNPYKKECWEYLTAIASSAAEIGFDEIQFDYVRFPVGEDASQADYGVDLNAHPKQEAIRDFLSYARTQLHEKDIVFGADVFGTIIGNDVDAALVGQDYQMLGSIADILSPMVYPSHYGAGVFGLDVPDAHPYETVYHALDDSKKELSSITAHCATVRPWLQCFTATWISGHLSYGADEIQAQIQAVYDAGYEEWILWNASNRYTADGLEH